MLEKCYAELVEYSLRTKMKPFLPYFYSFIPTKNVVLGLEKVIEMWLDPSLCCRSYIQTDGQEDPSATYMHL